MPIVSHVINRLKLAQEPFFAMLIGLPASGKSTFIKHAKEAGLDFIVASTDDLINAWAAERGLTYSEAWDKCPMKEFNRQFQEAIEQAVESKFNIMIDRTNMTTKGRKSLLAKASDDYTKVAIGFDIPDKLLQERLDHRAATTGKFIPPSVIKSMAQSYLPPSKVEGFKIITTVTV